MATSTHTQQKHQKLLVFLLNQRRREGKKRNKNKKGREKQECNISMDPLEHQQFIAFIKKKSLDIQPNLLV
jgi:hypothetical protein